MEKLNEFIYKIIGIDVKISNSIPRYERIKLILIGYLFLLNFLLTILAVSYAAYLTTNSIFSGILIALMVGISTYSINRLFLFSNSLKGNVSKFLIRYISLVLFSMVIAYTITIPLFLKTFDSEITATVIKQRYQEIDNIKTKFDLEIFKENEKLDELTKAFTSEITGKDTVSIGYYSSGVPGFGRRASYLEQEISKQKVIVEKIRLDKETSIKQVQELPISFSERLETLNHIFKQRNIGYIKWMFFSLLFIIEILPFITKDLLKIDINTKVYSNIETQSITSRKESVEKNKNSEFIEHCISLILSLEGEIEFFNRKATEQLRNGLLLSIIGILGYIGYGAFVFLVFFENHEFKNHHIFFMSSLTVVFLFIQFLSGWFLKQYRFNLNSTKDIKNQIDNYNKFILGEITTNSLTNTALNKKIKAQLLIELIGNGKVNLNTINESENENFAKELMSSLNEIKNLLNNFGNSSK